MKNSLLLLAGATALSLASCSQQKTADTTTTTTTAPADATATATPDTAVYRSRSQRVADKFVSDMKISDEATKAKIRTAYYNRSKRYATITSKYKADTTGMAAEMRQYNTDTDTEFKSIFTDPTQYQSYQSSRTTYDESNYLDDTNSGAAASSATTPTDNTGSSATSSSSDASADNSAASAGSTMSSGAAVKASKTKLEDGTKIKVKDDGKVKVKTSDGSKTKM